MFCFGVILNEIWNENEIQNEIVWVLNQILNGIQSGIVCGEDFWNENGFFVFLVIVIYCSEFCVVSGIEILNDVGEIWNVIGEF